MGTFKEEVLTWARKTVANDRVSKEDDANPNETDQQTYNFDAIKNALEVVTQCDRDGRPEEEPREVALAHNFLLYAHAVWTQPQAAKGLLKEEKKTRDLVLANEEAAKDFKRSGCRRADLMKRGRLLASIEYGAKEKATLVKFKQETDGLLEIIGKLRAEQADLKVVKDGELSEKKMRIQNLESELAAESAKFASMAQSLVEAGNAEAAAEVAKAKESIADATEKFKVEMATAQARAKQKQIELEAQLEGLRETNTSTSAERTQLQSVIERTQKLLTAAENQAEVLKSSTAKEIGTLTAALAAANEQRKSDGQKQFLCDVIKKQKDFELIKLRKQIEDHLRSIASDKEVKEAQRREITKINEKLLLVQQNADIAAQQAKSELKESKKALQDAQKAQDLLESKASSAAKESARSSNELFTAKALWTAQVDAAVATSQACQDNLKRAKEEVEGNRKSFTAIMKAFANITKLLDQTWYLPSSLITAIKKELDPLF